LPLLRAQSLDVVPIGCERAGLEHIAPHDLRRTCAKLCHSSGGELEQIQFLLGHASVQTTERYLGCKQNLGHPVNDLFDLRKDGRPNLRAVPKPCHDC
jgi:integrase